MKKQPGKRLALGREVVRALAQGALSDVRGGSTGDPSDQVSHMTSNKAQLLAPANA